MKPTCARRMWSGCVQRARLYSIENSTQSAWVEIIHVESGEHTEACEWEWACFLCVFCFMCRQLFGKRFFTRRLDTTICLLFFVFMSVSRCFFVFGFCCRFGCAHSHSETDSYLFPLTDRAIAKQRISLNLHKPHHFIRMLFSVVVILLYFWRVCIAPIAVGNKKYFFRFPKFSPHKFGECI